MKKCKKKAAISAGIPGLVDGGLRPTPGMLGWGMARNAGRSLAGRGQQLDSAIEAATNGTPAAQPRAAGPGGGLSNIRDGAVPPAHMLAAQRRGLADGGLPPGYAPLTPDRQAALAAKVEKMQQPPSNDIDTNYDKISTGYRGYGYRGGSNVVQYPLKDTVRRSRLAAGLPNGQQVRAGLGLADGGRGNADELETGDGGMVRGPGGPTDDKVGPVMLGNKEYVLPGDTVEAMGGPEALDVIRAKTHKFVDPAKKPAIARGLANGGLPGYGVNEIPVEEISMGRSRADRAAIDEAVKRGQRPPGMAKNPTRTPALDRVSSKMQANTAPKAAPSGRKATIAKGLGATGLAVGAYDSLADLENGYRDKFQQDMGVETPLGSVAADTARTLANVGDAVTFGLAGRTGRGIAKAMGGGSFMEGFGSPSDRSQFLAQQGGAQAAPLPDAPAAAQPGVAQAQIPGTAAPAAPSRPSIGKINVSRQPNGVMSFSGKGPVDGYEGPAAGQLKGGGYSGAVTPEDYRAAVARAEADKAAAANLDQPRGQQIAMRLPQTFGEAMQYRAAMAANRLNQRANESDARERTDRMRIAAGMPFEQERTRGAKLENDRSAILSEMVNTYLNAPDEATRSDALAKLNALNGKNGGADKYITVDMEAGVDALGNPIIRKVPFNTRTGQIVDVSGGAAAPGAGKAPYPDGTRLTGPDGKSYIVKNGEAELVQ